MGFITVTESSGFMDNETLILSCESPTVAPDLKLLVLYCAALIFISLLFENKFGPGLDKKIDIWLFFTIFDLHTADSLQ